MIDIFAIKPNVKIYPDEFKKIIEELKLKKEFDKEMETDLQLAIDQLENLYKKRSKLKNKPKLSINGKVIMDLYGIPPSEQVGMILYLLYQKVQSKEIEDNEESLIAELNSNENFYRSQSNL